MGKFISQNFTRVKCQVCLEITDIEPGHEFTKLNCNCDIEKYKPCQEIITYLAEDKREVELVGRFNNEDYAIRLNDKEFRIPKLTFENDFILVNVEIGTKVEDLSIETRTDIELESMSYMDLKRFAKELNIPNPHMKKREVLEEAVRVCINAENR